MRGVGEVVRAEPEGRGGRGGGRVGGLGGLEGKFGGWPGLEEGAGGDRGGYREIWGE